MPAGFPEGRFETEPEGFDAEGPDGRDELLPADGLDDWPDGLTADCPDGRDDEPDETAGDLRFEVLLEDLCTEVEREGPEEVRDAPFLVCANA